MMTCQRSNATILFAKNDIEIKLLLNLASFHTLPSLTTFSIYIQREGKWNRLSDKVYR